MSPIPFWNAEGNCEELEPMPDDFGTWSLGEQGEAQDATAYTKAEEILGSKVISARLLAESTNITSEVTLSDGRVVILRRIPLLDADANFLKRKFAGEIGITSFLQAYPEIPLPQTLGTATSGNCLYIVLEKMPGVIAFNCWSVLPLPSKERTLLSYASIMLKLFRLPLPINQDVLRIGTLLPDEVSGQVVLTPRIYVDIYAQRTVHHTFDEYIDSFVDCAITNYRRADDPNDAVVDLGRSRLERLRDALKRTWDKLPSNKTFLKRSVLHHDDLRPTNILLDPHSGEVTGIIDWEYHSVQPAVLGAEYPWWLMYSGQYDPRFASPHNWWHGNAEECRHYRDMYEQVVKEKDPEYYECLVQGQTLRGGISWLKPEALDPGCERLSRWMDEVFGKDSIE